MCMCRWSRGAAAGRMQASDIFEGESHQTGSQSKGSKSQTGGGQEAPYCCSGQRKPQGNSGVRDGVHTDLIVYLVKLLFFYLLQVMLK